MVNSTTIPRVVVVGSGAFARSVLYSIATEFTVPARVIILARNADKAAEVAYVAAARAAVSACPVEFDHRVVDLADGAAMTAALEESAPDVLVQCASYQSPWERIGAPSAWTELLRTAGFGIALPLQAVPLLDVVETIRKVAPDCLVVNGCFPDAVNPVLAAAGYPILCGIGNISTISAAILGQSHQKRLHLLAHHLHLHAPEDAANEARIWLDGTEQDQVATLLAGMRAIDRAELNGIGGHAAAGLLDALVTGATLDTHVPGPLGLPGGYPVRVRDRRIELRLPDGLDAMTAVAWNQRMSVLDGVELDGDRIRLPAAIKEHAPELAEGFPAAALRQACARLLDVREALRAGPPP
ncbi:saccharopine dehydrogenase NADP-binding domain-containing protein [Labedaea rhizosphaerae]|uniref:Saccharopine dehydrogenase-like protein n=1 Tax=Labedaea rhizosphaerae TaxID=598644 RepID=A0A4R6S635_LABRH|nr:saccharopine dehydrogenase NADP-binding domain-containing protein [Labedaea rhizosphaerae]TDP95220.1 saccharopine dehydrogenase-like protein [Labedaea rhizosphaerae]